MKLKGCMLFEKVSLEEMPSRLLKLTLISALVIGTACSSKDEEPEDLLVPDDPQLSIVSNFDSGDEGWLIVGDAQGGSDAPTYVEATDTESAHIEADDNGTGGTWYFQAPDKFLGDRLDLYGGTLTFDLRVTVNDGFDGPDVVLSSAEVIISTQLSTGPTGTFTNFEIGLEEAGWINGNGVAVDVNTFSQVLQNLDVLRIRGEYNVGSDKGSLDNVVMAYRQ